MIVEDNLPARVPDATIDAGMHPATLWEALADRLGDEPAVIQGVTTTTWQELDRQAAGLAATLQRSGLGAEAKVATYLFNGPEFLETYFAAFKIRAQPVNVNYRYLDAELAYLLENSDAEALVFHSSLADRVAAIDTGSLAVLIQVPDADTPLVPGAIWWDDAVDRPPADRCARGARDHHMLYTGGTTGLPKGVIYELGSVIRELVTMAAPVLGASPPSSVSDVVALAADARTAGTPLVAAILPPLMHGTGMAAALLTMSVGGTIVLFDGHQFDPTDALHGMEKHRVNLVSIVGDAFGRPLATSLDAAADADRPFDLSSVRMVLSSGAMLAAETKEVLLRHAPGAWIIDTLAASEGAMGTSISHAGASASTASFAVRPGTKVFDEHNCEVAAGSGIAGRVAVAATNPIGYYNDPVKTAATFQEIDGIRYTFPGDWAHVEVDGSITLLGRGSHCITTGGEKVFPEEVEEALKTHPAVVDALVLGIDDDKWGQRIEAAVSTRTETDTASLTLHVKGRLAAYKAPKVIHVVDVVPRAPNGKADYSEARRLISRSVRQGESR